MKESRYFSIKQFNITLWKAAYVMAKYTKELKRLPKKFRSNIMIAVTNVNGCRACSYFHSSELLKAGASEEELKQVLAGAYENLETDEMLALVFAEHYADTFGDYESEAFDKLSNNYGLNRTNAVMASIKAIMFGNIFGISLGHMWDRIRFKKVKNSKFFTDLYIILFTMPLMLIFLIIQLFRKKKKVLL